MFWNFHDVFYLYFDPQPWIINFWTSGFIMIMIVWKLVVILFKNEKKIIVIIADVIECKPNIVHFRDREEVEFLGYYVTKQHV